MKRERPLVTAALIFLLLPLFHTTAWANSSWVWISETRPVDVLPWVAIATIAIETLSISRALEWKRTGRVFLTVCGANLISFLVPYLVGSVENLTMGYSFLESLEKQAGHWPSWIVGAGYLCLTVVAEFPLVYYSLEKKAPDRRRLFTAFAVSNAATTAMTFAAERLLCRGHW